MTKIEIRYRTLSVEELSSEDGEMLESAINALPYSHSPYSNFKVACAVRMVDGTLVTGTNQENAAYPSGLCAERVALFAARGSSRKDINTLLIVARNEHDKPADAFSCGSCRQVMMEYAGQQSASIRILLGTKEGTFHLVDDVKVLLPFHFDADTLG